MSTLSSSCIQIAIWSGKSARNDSGLKKFWGFRKWNHRHGSTTTSWVGHSPFLKTTGLKRENSVGAGLWVSYMEKEGEEPQSRLDGNRGDRWYWG